MNVIISGFGRMGALIEEALVRGGDAALAVTDPNVKAERTRNGTGIYRDLGAVGADLLESADVGIDFTHPSCAVDNIKAFAEKKIPLVVGTTGWYDRLPEVRKIVREEGASLLYAANFALGVNLFYKVAAFAAALFDKYEEYDAAGFEVHHNRKADSPSGTAKAISGLVLKNMTRKTSAVYDKLDRAPGEGEFHFASLRVGSVPGVHSVCFDSAADTVEITHRARNRDGLVSGAVLGARRLLETIKERGAGIYTLEDVL